MNDFLKRSVVSTIVAATFLVVGGTGVLMFFHVRGRIINGLHEWIGMAFVLMSLFHVLMNWKALLGYLKKPATMLPIALVLILCVVVALTAPEKKRRPQSVPQASAAAAVVR